MLRKTNHDSKPAFATWERSTLNRLAHDLWDQNTQLRKQLETLKLQMLDLKRALADDLK